MSIERGVLQGLREYRVVGVSIIFEAVGRLVTGLILVAPGLGVTGAFLGTPLSMLITAGVLFVLLRRRLGKPHPDGKPHRLLLLFRQNWAPQVALAMVALLQVLDQLIIKHRIGGDKAGAYIAATVAAKAVIWVAIGVGLHLLPEATRLAAEGRDPRPALRKALGLIVVIASPALLIFLVVPKLLLRVAYGHPEFQQASGALVILGAAFAVLAVSYLAVQYLLALGRIVFLPILAAVVAGEGIALLQARTLVGYATTVLVMQCLAAAAVLFVSLRRVPARVPLSVPSAP
jgi:O-antigen/teichoic acid export membrane protein